jgi:hypothetical protein
MSFEKPEHLSEDRAHDEANTLQAEVTEQKMRQSRKHGAPEGRESTAADYDNALAKLEELKQQINAEPTPDKVRRVLANFIRLPAMALWPLTGPANRLMEGIDKLMEKTGVAEPTSKEDREGYNASQKEFREGVMREMIDDFFSEEENKLRRMKAAGRKFGEEEKAEG